LEGRTYVDLIGVIRLYAQLNNSCILKILGRTSIL
jgi:hypothetical protein